LGGDLDVVATAEGKLAYLELKSSPPKNLEPREIVAFFDRMCILRPDVTLFVVDTALRLSDKVYPCSWRSWNIAGAEPESSHVESSASSGL
jgi:hypothetical protein